MDKKVIAIFSIAAVLVIGLAILGGLKVTGNATTTATFESVGFNAEGWLARPGWGSCTLSVLADLDKLDRWCKTKGHVGGLATGNACRYEWSGYRSKVFWDESYDDPTTEFEEIYLYKLSTMGGYGTAVTQVKCSDVSSPEASVSTASCEWSWPQTLVHDGVKYPCTDITVGGTYVRPYCNKAQLSCCKYSGGAYSDCVRRVP